jgi:hypothetical protein
MTRKTKRPFPKTLAQWLREIELAIEDARATEPFARMTGTTLTDENLFHLAPIISLKFRGLDYRDEQLRQKVTEGALATYVVNSEPESETGINLKTKPLMAFALCYVTAHFVLDLLEEEDAEAILNYCEEHLEE